MKLASLKSIIIIIIIIIITFLFFISIIIIIPHYYCFSIYTQGRVSPNGVKGSVHRYDETAPITIRATEDSVTDSGTEQDALKADSEKGIVKLSSV